MIKELRNHGVSINDLDRELQVDRQMVRNYIQAPLSPMATKRKEKSKLDPFKDKGYDGGKTILKDYIKPYREAG